MRLPVIVTAIVLATHLVSGQDKPAEVKQEAAEAVIIRRVFPLAGPLIPTAKSFRPPESSKTLARAGGTSKRPRRYHQFQHARSRPPRCATLRRHGDGTSSLRFRSSPHHPNLGGR